MVGLSLRKSNFQPTQTCWGNDRKLEVFDQYQKPIWITEFAVRDPDATTIENNQYSPEQVLEFMEAVLPELEDMEFVHRYSWFSTSTSNENYAKTATSVLIDDDNQITPLGEFYANFTED